MDRKVTRIFTTTNLQRTRKNFQNKGLKNTVLKISRSVRKEFLNSAVGGSKIALNPLPPTYRQKSFPNVKVAGVFDEFSATVWSEEFDLTLITKATAEQIAAGDQSISHFDLLFVESAWNGNSGEWQYQLTGQSAPSKDLVALVSAFQAQGIPTVFWNKEDPTHFEEFIDTAALFDHIFTTASERIEDYKQRTNATSVHLLPFAASASLHNPIRRSSTVRDGEIAFGGMYFAHKFPERREQMDLLLGAAANVSKNDRDKFVIFSRYVGGEKKYQFPAPLDGYVVGSLPYDKMLRAYRKFKVFLNVNSVVNSESMCARRVFELTAAGALVVSTSSPAIRHFFDPNELFVVEAQREAELLLRSVLNSKLLRDRQIHRGQRKIWGQHTYAHRAARVVEVALGTSTELQKPPRVSVIASTNRPDQLGHLFNQVGRQRGVEVELCLMQHGFDLGEAELHQLASEHDIDVLKIRSADESLTLGECLNELVAISSSPYISKMDDDDFYGEHYLFDLVQAHRFSGADLIGKQAVYVDLVESGAKVLRSPEKEHRWTEFVAGPTLFGPRETFEEFPFASKTRGEDSDLLNRLVRAGKRIYSSDRFNFVQVRHGNSHTWESGDLEFLANGTVVQFEDFRRSVEF
ncbi:Spore protein YkvP [Corynebacterium gottingense]|uniref:Glycosyltransferase n=1 Tax=Corynebacterium gottingense TaxID=2041036 RepID=A0ABX9UKP2_9CORY|nr:glycosyltransferase [Corynebacterium gottingense]WJZ13640.1 Spore protein YkvP [Corynebacterium gottingense]WJZ15955.1 Spore protein YkvP [Corynebacterium gottingense]